MSEPSRSAFMPREELIEKAVARRRMSFGMPHDVHDDEKRIALTPEAVKILTDAGHEVVMETGAGANAGFSDMEYSDNGAIVADTSQQIYQQPVPLPFALGP